MTIDDCLVAVLDGACFLNSSECWCGWQEHRHAHTHSLSHTHAHWHRYDWYDGMTTFCMCSIQKQIDSDRVWYRVHLLCTVCRYAYVGINKGLYLINSYDIFCCSLPAGSACRNEAAFCPPLAPISCRLMKAKRARNARNEHNSAYIQHNEPM